jgi:mevalonate kinase
MTSAQAPGKIILFGEHAVVYGRPALAVPVTEVQARVDVAGSAHPGVRIDAPDIQLHADLDSLPSDHPLAVVIRTMLAQAPADHLKGGKGLAIKITSSIPVAAGLGSGAAVSVALIRALACQLAEVWSDEQVNALAFEVEKLHHGTPSGIDNTVITYAGPVFFVKGQPIETFKAGAPFTIVIGDTGVPAPTRESVADVRRLWRSDGPRWEGVFDRIGRIAESAREKIVAGDWQSLGELMNQNHALLQELTVSSLELDRLIEAARAAGARGAKLSGGGRGGNMIALITLDSAEAVSQALQRAGARHALQTTIQP